MLKSANFGMTKLWGADPNWSTGLEKKVHSKSFGDLRVARAPIVDGVQATSDTLRWCISRSESHSELEFDSSSGSLIRVAGLRSSLAPFNNPWVSHENPEITRSWTTSRRTWVSIGNPSTQQQQVASVAARFVGAHFSLSRSGSGEQVCQLTV